jgi:cell division protein FtsB
MDAMGHVAHWVVTRYRRSRRRVATAVLLAFSLLMGYYVIFDKDGVAAYVQKKHQAQEQQQQIQLLQQENQRLAEHDQRLKNDPDAIEHEARKQLHYTHSGEVIYTLPEAPHSAPPSAKPAK